VLEHETQSAFIQGVHDEEQTECPAKRPMASEWGCLEESHNYEDVPVLRAMAKTENTNAY